MVLSQAIAEKVFLLFRKGFVSRARRVWMILCNVITQSGNTFSLPFLLLHLFNRYENFESGFRQPRLLDISKKFPNQC